MKPQVPHRRKTKHPRPTSLSLSLSFCGWCCIPVTHTHQGEAQRARYNWWKKVAHTWRQNTSQWEKRGVPRSFTHISDPAWCVSSVLRSSTLHLHLPFSHLFIYLYLLISKLKGMQLALQRRRGCLWWPFISIWAKWDYKDVDDCRAYPDLIRMLWFIYLFIYYLYFLL